MLEKPQDAIEKFKLAIDIDSMFLEAHHNLGNVYQDMFMFGEAIKCYERALSIDPNFEESQKNLGSCLLGNGEHRRGLRYLRKSCGVIEFTLGSKAGCQIKN